MTIANVLRALQQWITGGHTDGFGPNGGSGRRAPVYVEVRSATPRPRQRY